MTAEFVWPARVYWEDTDAGGVVYYANYLKFMERARTEWLRAVGIEQIPLKEQHGILLVIAQVEANYRRPARYGDVLQVTCRVIDCGKASLTFAQNIYRAVDDDKNMTNRNITDELQRGELLLDGRTRVACVDAISFKPRALPETIVRELKQ